VFPAGLLRDKNQEHRRCSAPAPASHSWLARPLANLGERPPGEAPELFGGRFGNFRRRHPGLKFREPAAEFGQVFGRKFQDGFFDVFDPHEARIVVTAKERKRNPDAALPRSARRRVFRVWRQVVGDFEPRRLAGDEAVQFRPYRWIVEKRKCDAVLRRRRIGKIRGRFPTRGSENIRKNLRQEYGMRVSRQAHTSFRVLVTFQLTRRTGQRKLISDYLKATEPDAVASRRHRRFLRKRFYSAGVNDIWCQDQHDKWLRFGLFFHNNIDPFMMYNNWLKVWWTVKNPRLIASYYFETVRKLGGE